MYSSHVTLEQIAAAVNTSESMKEVLEKLSWSGISMTTLRRRITRMWQCGIQLKKFGRS